jgi:hypothetical protein
MGFKKTSETIAISFGVTETALNTFTQEEIALQLDILNNEIFVVLAVDLDNQTPDMVAGTSTSVSASICSTTQLAVQRLDNTNCIATAQLAIRADAPTNGVSFSRGAFESPTGDVSYIALIATNNFFAQVAGFGNLGAKAVSGRVWGYRAKADSATYAALVQSEVLSA